MSNENMIFHAENGERLDVALARLLSKSRSQVSKDIKGGCVSVNQAPEFHPSFILKETDEIQYSEPVVEKKGFLKPADSLKLDYIYKDEDIAIIDKPRGMVVHPAPGHADDTLVNYLFDQDESFDFSKDDTENMRPGIVHRIDKDTQGLLAIAENPKSEASLQEEIRSREFHRCYLALVYGNVKDRKFRIDAPLTKPNHTNRRAKVDIYKGRDAITHCVLLANNGKVSLLKCTLETGRTHQIRAHLAYIGFPIVGDPVYGHRKETVAMKGQALTAYSLSLIHPRTLKRMNFYAPIDEYFKELIRYFFK
ncbi:MAG: RluA family pseudouridine synthase [Bacilli bacterium]